MRVLWYWPHAHRGLHPGAEVLVRAGDALTVQCLDTHRGQADDPRVRFRRELPQVRPLSHVPGSARKLLRIETYARRSIMRERLVRSEPFDVCYVGTLNYLTDAFALPRLRRMVPLAVVVHDVVPHEARMPAKVERRLLERVYGSADVFVVLHDYVGRRLSATFGVEPSRIVVAPLPIVPMADDPDVERRNGSTRFLFFGGFRTDKGIPVLLDAAARLVSDGSCTVHFAGTGDPRLEEAVRAAAARREVTAEIGWVSDDRRKELFRAADVVVLPYDDSQRFQSQSGVIADAYAFGKPVIVGDVGAIGPTVSSDSTGWVVPAGDAAALAERMREVAHDAAARRAAAAAIAAVLPKYSPEAYGSSVRAALELAVASR